MSAQAAARRAAEGQREPGTPGSQGEQKLIRAARNGSEDAAEELVRRHWDNAHRAAYLIVHDAAAAEDIAQESIVAALSGLERFDRRRRFAPWLHRIVANRAIDWLRSRERRREVAFETPSSITIAPADQAVPLAGSPIGSALAALDPESRAVVVLSDLLGYRSHEIARMRGVSSGAVRTRLHRARHTLRETLGEEG